ncbi:hypothetical protein ACIP98_21160 [Streptomyces sp. NPDC088354]|uniref:hypothetical protein n=1 Tax=Streptomyces sp. NPDC088354 TaxID=3365856 RepID=UPI0038014FDE
MSELLHGRGPWMDVVHWEAGDLLEGPTPKPLRKASETLSDVLILNLRQIRLCLATLGEERGKLDIPGKVLSFSLEGEYAGSAPPKFASLIPLLPDAGLRPAIVAGLEEAAQAHRDVLRGRRPAGRLYRDDEFAHLHFYERRARAARWALRAFDLEEKRMGELDFEHLSNRDFRYLLAAEMAGILSVWLRGSRAGDAAAACSTALRSAYWLWLEDDDRALAELRVLLDQCARWRVWTQKPERAQKLEASSASSPKDWLAAAGWRRLAALNKALGEFAHAHAKIRWNGAREILQKIQAGEVDPEDSVHLARGHALNALTVILFTEAINSASSISPIVGDAFKQIVHDLIMEEDNLTETREGMFNRVFAHKDTSLGSYSWIPANGK